MELKDMFMLGAMGLLLALWPQSLFWHWPPTITGNPRTSPDAKQIQNIQIAGLLCMAATAGFLMAKLTGG